MNRIFYNLTSLFLAIFSTIVFLPALHAQTEGEGLLNEAERFWGANSRNTHKILKKGADPNITDKDGNTPLHYAVIGAYNREFISLLLYYGADLSIKNKDDKTPLDLAQESVNGKKYLSLLKNPDDLGLPFYLKYGSFKEIKSLTEKNPESVQKPDENGVNPLLYACKRKDDNVKVVKFLLEKGASTELDFLDMMDISIDTENTELIRVLIEAHSDSIPSAPLCYAIDKQSFELTEMLISAGASLNDPDKDYIPTEWAFGKSYKNRHARKMNTQIIRLLLEKDAFLPLRSCAEYAADQKNADSLLHILYKNGLKPEQSLFHAVREGDEKLFELSVATGADVNAQLRNGYGLVIIAARRNKLRMLELLNKYGANLRQKDNSGSSALIHAATKGSTEAAEYLLQNGCSPSEKNNRGLSALFYATSNSVYGNLEIIKTLVEAGAPLNDSCSIKTDRERGVYTGSYLGAAAHFGFFDAVKYYVEEVKLPINGKSYIPTIKSFTGFTPLQHALSENHSNIALYLMKKGARINVKDKYGRTPLLYALKRNDQKMLEVLREKNPSIEGTDSEGNTCLHLSVKNSDTESLHYILNKEDNINQKNNDGNTALHLALQSPQINYEILRLLAGAEADFEIRNKDGKSVYDILEYEILEEDQSRRAALALGIQPESYPGNALMRKQLIIEDEIPFKTDFDTLPYPEYFLRTNTPSAFLLEHLLLDKFSDSSYTQYSDYKAYPLYKSRAPVQTYAELQKNIGDRTDSVITLDAKGEYITVEVKQEADPEQFGALNCYDAWYFDEKNFKLRKENRAYAPVRQYLIDGDFTTPRKKHVSYIIPKDFKNKRKRRKAKERALKVKQIKYEMPLVNFWQAAEDNFGFKENLNYSPYLNSFALEKLRSLISDAPIAGRMPAYDFYTGEKLKPAEVYERFGNRTDSVYTIDPDTGEEILVLVENNTQLNEIQSLIFVEEWYLDTVSMKLFKEVTGIAPVVYREYSDDDYYGESSPKRTVPYIIYFKQADFDKAEKKYLQIAMPLNKKSETKGFIGFNKNSVFEIIEQTNFSLSKTYTQKALSGEIDLYRQSLISSRMNFDKKSYERYSKDEIKEKTCTDNDTCRNVGIFTNEIWSFNRKNYSFEKTVFSYSLFSRYTIYDDYFRLNGFILNRPGEIDEDKLTKFRSLRYEQSYDDYEEMVSNSEESGIEKSKPLFYSNYHELKFKKQIMEDILSGKVKACFPGSNRVMSKAQLDSALTAEEIRIEDIDPNTGEFIFTKQKILLESGDIVSLIFTEDWYIDPESLQLQKRVKSIAPVFLYKKINEDKARKLTPFEIKLNTGG